MWDLYRSYYMPFGQVLTDMEAAGMLVDRGHLREAQVRALKQRCNSAVCKTIVIAL